MLNVPSGFTHVEDTSLDNPVTRTRRPDTRAATCADTTSGRDESATDATGLSVTGVTAPAGTTAVTQPVTTPPQQPPP